MGSFSHPRNTGSSVSGCGIRSRLKKDDSTGSFLDSLGYDSDDRFLAVNEFQAYLMQQPLRYALSYFERFFARFGEPGTPEAVRTGLRSWPRRRSWTDSFRSTFGVRAGETVASRRAAGTRAMRRFFPVAVLLLVLGALPAVRAPSRLHQ